MASRNLESGHRTMAERPDESKSEPADQTLAVADRGVMAAIGDTIGSVPRVMLRDTEAGLDEPPIKVASSKVPDAHGRYQFFGEIARGGMGAVLKGRDVDLGRDLAVKVLLEQFRDHPEHVRRFVEEAQIGGQLQHPGIVPVYELGTFPDRRPYFAMKLVKGRTLAAMLDAREKPSADRARFLGIFEQVAQTVAYAHARGVIHRDLKPSNIMVGAFGEVQVMDWGLAKVLPQGGAADDEKSQAARTDVSIIQTIRGDTPVDASQAGSVLGTPAYMAPEQASGDLDLVDERADVFALGSILCEILTGRAAHVGRSLQEVLRKATRGDMDDAAERLAACDADAELTALARDCMAPEPVDRPRNAGVVAGRMTAYLSGVQDRLHATELARAAEEARAEEATRTAVAAHAQAAAERRSRRLTLALATAVIGLIGLGGGGVTLLKNQRAARSAKTARGVNEALAEALRLEGTARSAAVADPLPWSMALAEAKRAEALLWQGEADPILHSRVAATLANLSQKHDEAARLAENDRIDRKLLADLDAARTNLAMDMNLQKEDEAYAAAFRAAGIDMDRNDPQTVGRWIAARKVSVEIAAFLDDWSFIRYQLLAPGKEGAEGRRRARNHLIDAARAADPDPWRNTLRLGSIGDPEALRALADDERTLEDKGAVSLNLLVIFLKSIANDPTRAERVSRLNWRLHPGDFWVNIENASLQKTPEDRLRFLTAAIAARPDMPYGFYELTNALSNAGRHDEALEMGREAIRRHPEDASTRGLLGIDLVRSGHAEEGIAQLRRSVELKGGAIEYFYLGAALEGEGKREEALPAFREAVKLDGEHLGSAIFSLGDLLKKMGRYDEAIEAYRHARVLAENEGKPGDVKRADDAARLTARQKDFAARLPGLISGTDRLKDGSELMEVTWLCTDRRFYASGVRIFDQMLKADPNLVAGVKGGWSRYDAACLAAQAGCRQDDDQPPLDDAAKARFRAQALALLRAELVEWSELFKEGNKEVVSRLDRWRTDSTLTDVRLPVSLAKLPDDERQAWQAFWSDVEALRRRAAGEDGPK
jgi:serine/threonine-protein kinase